MKVKFLKQMILHNSAIYMTYKSFSEKTKRSIRILKQQQTTLLIIHIHQTNCMQHKYEKY